MATASKERLLEKAMTVFAAKGFPETSTREIAQAAGVNISAIAYYFGGKKGLYQAILEDIVHRVRTAMEDHIDQAVAVLTDEKATPEQAENTIYTMTIALGKLLYSQNLPDEAVTVFLHEYSNPGDSFSTLYQGLIYPVYKIFADLIIKATGVENSPEKTEEIILYTYPLFAGLFVFKTRKDTLLKHLNWKNYGDAEIDKILKMLTKHIKAILDLYKNETKQD